jgi:septal ring factor EnvC (AmiA/AmiB activator)
VVGVASDGERAHIRLYGDAGFVWASLPRSEKVKLASVFRELIVYYASAKELQAGQPMDTLLSAVEMIKSAYEVCRSEKERVEERARKLKERYKRARSSVNAMRQRLESLERQVGELKQQLSRLEAERRSTERLLQSLAATLCPHMETVKQLARSERAVYDLEHLCRGVR